MNDAPIPAGTIVAANPVEHAILERRAVRGFRPDPVPHETVLHLLDVAARAPSGTNMQPWQVIALAGDALDDFRERLVAAYLSGDGTDKIEHIYYPSPLFEPYISRRRKIGWDLYGLLGIARGETDKMRAQVANNLRFFGAPVGLICLIDKRMRIGSWIDYGMFLQNLCLAARARGLDSCPMAVFAEFPRTIRRLLAIPEEMEIVCGFALGTEDRDAPANALRTERVPAASFTDFRGF